MEFRHLLKELMKYSIIGFFLQCVFLNLIVASSSEAQKYQSIKNIYISVQLEDASIEEAFNWINNNTDLNLNYDNIHIKDLDTKINFRKSNSSIEELLLHISKKAKLKFKQVNNNISVDFIGEKKNELKIEVIIQGVKIQGRVTSSEDNEGLPGVNVIVIGTVQGTVTDVEGNYALDVPGEETVIVFSSVGFLKEEVVVGKRTVIDMVLTPDLTALDEIVVTAFGLEREKKALGYAAQELESKDLSGARELNVASYLTGKIAGVQVSKTASGAGGSTNVVIRGNSSISGSNQPLYVVDGVPIINYSNSGSGSGIGGNGDYDYGDGIGDLNTQDVESMNVLKGPAATALYGSRGANGVILITTKSGRTGEGFGVELNSNVTFDKLNLFPNYQNKYGSGYDDNGVSNYGTNEIDGENYYYPEWGNLDSWGGPLDGSFSIVDVYRFPDDDGPARTMPYVAQPKNNVRDLFFQTGVTIANTVAITGGDEKSTLRLSAGQSSTKGIIPNHEFKKKSLSFRGSTRVKDIVTIETKVNYLRTEGSQRPATGYSQYNPIYNLAIMSRFTPLDFIKEYYERTGSYERFPGMNYNPWYITNEIKNNDHRDRVLGFSSVTIDFNDWLSLMGRVGLDFYSEVREKRWPEGARGSDSKRGRMTESMLSSRELNADLLLTANKQISDNFHVNLVLGTSLLSQHRQNMNWDARDFKAKDVYYISNFNDVRPSSSLYEKEIQSIFFSGQLAYKNYLFLDITGRNDWASTLGVDNPSYFYPSVSTSFVFTDALAIESDVFSFGKIRVSWAQVGSDSNPYLTTSGYSLYSTGFNGRGYASKSGTIPLWDLKNELTQSWEVGADFRFFKNRLSLDLTYYDAKTSNQILSLPISIASGYSREVINAGEIRNSGFEATLGITPISTGNFRWDINANFSANKSEVIVLDGNIETYRILNTNLNDIHAQVGEPYGNIIGYKYLRAPDGQKIVSSGGSYQRESKHSVLGNINPDWIGGLNNTFSYRGFSLNILLDFVQGGEVSSHTKERMTAKGTGAWTEEGRRPVATDANGDQLPYIGVLDGVVLNDDGTYSPNTKAVPGHTYWANRAWSSIGEEFVLDGSYISLREVIFGYNFKPSMLQNTPFESITLSIIGRNLMYLEEHMSDLGVSPESAPNTSGGASGIEALAVPSTRSVGFNVKLSF